MKNFDENELIDKAMAGRLTPEEQRRWEALLVERPDLQADLEVGRALKAVPPPPTVASNFTALVMRQINRPEPPSQSRPWARWLAWPRLIRASAVGAVVIGLSLQLHHQHVEKQKVAATVRTFTDGVRAVSDPTSSRSDSALTVLQDFEAIRQLPVSNADVDNDLLMALSSNP